MMRGRQVRSPEPQPQRHLRLVHHRARGHRGLRAAALALPHPPSVVHRPDLTAAASPAAKPFGPTAREQVLPTRLLRGEPLLELHDRQREPGPGHPVKLRPTPDGKDRVCTWGDTSSALRFARNGIGAIAMSPKRSRANRRRDRQSDRATPPDARSCWATVSAHSTGCSRRLALRKASYPICHRSAADSLSAAAAVGGVDLEMDDPNVLGGAVFLTTPPPKRRGKPTKEVRKAPPLCIACFGASVALTEAPKQASTDAPSAGATEQARGGRFLLSEPTPRLYTPRRGPLSEPKARAHVPITTIAGTKIRNPTLPLPLRPTQARVCPPVSRTTGSRPKRQRARACRSLLDPRKAGAPQDGKSMLGVRAAGEPAALSQSYGVIAGVNAAPLSVIPLTRCGGMLGCFAKEMIALAITLYRAPVGVLGGAVQDVEMRSGL